MKNYTIPSSHPDLAILCEFTETEKQNIGNSMKSGNLNNRDSYECNYMRTYNLRYWEQESTMQLADIIEKANLQTTEYRFELVDVTNFEADDDRTWPASFTFKSHKK
jgi:hypothetical protein